MPRSARPSRPWPSFTALVCAALAASCAAGAQRPGAASGSADPALAAEIRALNDSMVATFARGDVAGVARFYADDGRLVGPRRATVRGRAEIDRYWAGIRNPKAWRLEVLEIGGTRDAAYQVGVSSLTSVGPDGAERTYVSEFVVIWKRQPDGSLRIALDLYT